MRRLSIKKTITSEVIKEHMKNSPCISDFKRWQVIYLVFNYPVDADFLSNATGYSKANIYSIIRQFNNERDDISTKDKGGRRRALMSLEEERRFMKGLEDKAMKGQILSFHDIKNNAEAAVGKDVSEDYLWDLFKRHGWTKHTPRPSHPKKNDSEQQQFKKNSKTVWIPLKMILAKP